MSIYQDNVYKHGIGWSTWHFQWVTKYRYRVFADSQLQKLCEIFLRETAKRHRFEIEAMEGASDHVHVIAKLRFSMSPSHAVQLMKGYTARMLFMAEEQRLHKFYWGTKNRSLWGDGKFIASWVTSLWKKQKNTLQITRLITPNFYFYQGNPHPLGWGRMSNLDFEVWVILE